FLLRGGGDRPAVGVVNEDAGPLGAAVATALVASGQVDATRMGEATAAAELRDGTIAGYVLLPNDFSRTAPQSLVIRPEIHVEGSQPSQSGAVVQATDQAMASAAASTLAGTGVRPPAIEPQVTYLYAGPSLATLDYFGGAFVGLIIFFLVFVVTCVAFLRERSQGTLERLMASPLRRAEIVVGYMLGFTTLALAQGAEVLVFSLA